MAQENFSDGESGLSVRTKITNNFTELYAMIRTGTGTPEGAVTAPVGTLFVRTDGSAGTHLYMKRAGTGNTGWVAV